MTHLRGAGRGDRTAPHLTVITPTRLDEEQERLLRELATRRGEERPVARMAAVPQGVFSKLRDRFAGRRPPPPATAPLYLLDGAGAPQFAWLTAGDPLVLDGDEGRHAATVRRTRVGQRLDVAMVPVGWPTAWCSPSGRVGSTW